MPLPVAPGRPLPGDGMLVEFASAVDAVTFAVGTRVARCLRFCETDPPCDGLLPYLETAAKLLKSLEGILSLLSKCALKSLNNQTDFDSAILAFARGIRWC
jgi:hypothetical protein